jgi:hypothetical protein
VQAYEHDVPLSSSISRIPDITPTFGGGAPHPRSGSASLPSSEQGVAPVAVVPVELAEVGMPGAARGLLREAGWSSRRK